MPVGRDEAHELKRGSFSTTPEEGVVCRSRCSPEDAGSKPGQRLGRTDGARTHQEPRRRRRVPQGEEGEFRPGARASRWYSWVWIHRRSSPQEAAGRSSGRLSPGNVRPALARPPASVRSRVSPGCPGAVGRQGTARVATVGQLHVSVRHSEVEKVPQAGVRPPVGAALRSCPRPRPHMPPPAALFVGEALARPPASGASRCSAGSGEGGEEIRSCSLPFMFGAFRRAVAVKAPSHASTSRFALRRPNRR